MEQQTYSVAIAQFYHQHHLAIWRDALLRRESSILHTLDCYYRQALANSPDVGVLARVARDSRILDNKFKERPCKPGGLVSFKHGFLPFATLPSYLSQTLPHSAAEILASYVSDGDVRYVVMNDRLHYPHARTIESDGHAVAVLQNGNTLRQLVEMGHEV